MIESIPGPDGAEHQWLVNKFLFTSRSGERFVGGVAMDITSLKRVEALLRHGEERYRLLIENSQGLICPHDLAGTILSINPAALRALDYRAEEVVGRNLKDFLLREFQDQFARYLERVAQTGQDLGLMVVVTSRDSPARGSITTCSRGMWPITCTCWAMLRMSPSCARRRSTSVRWPSPTT